jgi:hypothetical protein
MTALTLVSPPASVTTRTNQPKPKIPDHAVISDGGRRWQRIPLFLHLRCRRP